MEDFATLMFHDFTAGAERRPSIGRAGVAANWPPAESTIVEKVFGGRKSGWWEPEVNVLVTVPEQEDDVPFLQLPLSLLKTAQNHPMLVELKNGETYNGHLVSCDNWMNINLREVICTSRDGDKFWRMPECYIRGSTIKYLRIPDEIIDMVKEEVVSKGRGRGGMQQQKQQKGRGVGGTGRGVFGGRGRGGIPGSGRGQQEKKPGRQAAKQ
ncbi:hypothetical protein lerEdw1_008520 [Lerista edwardsae]|nr:hypothetical protein lerEdw1_008520 [Lerista edwardsae]